MLLSDSQISMRPICLDLLFKPVECIFVTYLKKCLSSYQGSSQVLVQVFAFVSFF